MLMLAMISRRVASGLLTLLIVSVVVFVGTNILPGQYRRGSIVDLAPTVLYYLGLPVGRDMDGFARTDIFPGTFTLERPVSYTQTHER